MKLWQRTDPLNSRVRLVLAHQTQKILKACDLCAQRNKVPKRNHRLLPDSVVPPSQRPVWGFLEWKFCRSYEWEREKTNERARYQNTSIPDRLIKRLPSLYSNGWLLRERWCPRCNLVLLAVFPKWRHHWAEGFNRIEWMPKLGMEQKGQHRRNYLVCGRRSPRTTVE